jgi:hypothetical protein
LFDLIRELIVNVGVDEMCAWNINFFGFWSHRNETISEGSLVCYRQRLQNKVSHVTNQQSPKVDTWSSQTINCATERITLSREKPETSSTMPKAPSSFACFFVNFLPAFEASISFQIDRGIAQFCIGMFSASQRS